MMKSWVILLVIGLVMLAGGILALLNPFGATLAVEIFVGWVFLFTGAVQFFAAFGAGTTGQKIWGALAGLIAIFVGIALLNNPLAGMMALTLLVATLFLISGAAKTAFAFATKAEHPDYFWPTLLSGAISLLLAVLIFTGYPASAATILGILLGVELIANGIFAIAGSFAARNMQGSDPA